MMVVDPDRASNMTTPIAVDEVLACEIFLGAQASSTSRKAVLSNIKNLFLLHYLEKGNRFWNQKSSFFHLIFTLASMYSAMLLSGWTSSESSDLIDVGWTSVWVRICTEWVTARLYIWSLVAPFIFPDREFY